MCLSTDVDSCLKSVMLFVAVTYAFVSYLVLAEKIDLAVI